jgi:CRP/FNR family cyclic AMP-dependent transcriptional regulator
MAYAPATRDIYDADSHIMELPDFLKKYADPLLREEIPEVSYSASIVTDEEVAVIMSQGDDTDSLYIIASGRIKVGISDEEGKEVILSMLGPGQFFGEMSLVDDHPRSANIETMEASEFVVINKDDFKRFLSQNFDMALAFMKELVRRLREADKKIESLALMDVYGRVARVLLDMAEETVDGKLIIKRRLTKQDIARMIGASREMVSRVMKDLVEMEHVSFRGTVIVLHENLAESAR